MNNNGLDVFVVFETHLSSDVPDVVNIPSYSVFRWDRNWLGNDMRKKGVEAIYVRSNLKVLDIIQSSLYEVIFLILLLPMGHCLLVCGIYHPPKYKYNECDLMNYIINIADSTLDKYPNAVCRGDLNRLNLHQLQILSVWNVLVGFPTRGDVCLDNVLSNHPDLFGKRYPVQMLMRTDHKGIILPAGSKLKPICCKVKVCDCRDPHKFLLYDALARQNWDNLVESSDVDQAVNCLESMILGHMGRYMPYWTVSISS